MNFPRAAISSILLCSIIFQGWVAQQHFQLQAEAYGLMPRDVTSLSGIITMPMFHGSAEHLWGNLLALFCLSFLLALFSPGLLPRAILIMWLVGGSLLWLVGRSSWHIGASGLVYGLIAWFPALALLRRNRSYTVLTMVVLLYYGSAIWGLLPLDPHVSYEGHLTGLMSGIIAAFLLRKHIRKDPKPDEEDPDEPEDDPYRRFDYRQRDRITPGDSS